MKFKWDLNRTFLLKTSQILHNHLYSDIYINIELSHELLIYIYTSTKNQKYKPSNPSKRPRTDYVKNDGWPEHSSVQQAAPA